MDASPVRCLVTYALAFLAVLPHVAQADTVPATQRPRWNITGAGGGIATDHAAAMALVKQSVITQMQNDGFTDISLSCWNEWLATTRGGYTFSRCNATYNYPGWSAPRTSSAPPVYYEVTVALGCDPGYTLNGNMCVKPDHCQMFPGDLNTPRDQPSNCQCPADTKWVPMSGCRKTCYNSGNVGAYVFNRVEFPSGKDEACMNGCIVQAKAGEYIEYRDGSRLSEATQTNWACSVNGEPGTAKDPQPEAVKIPDSKIKKPKCAEGEGVLTTSTGGVRCLPPGTPGTRVPQVTTRDKFETYADGSTQTTTTTVTRDPGTGAIFTSSTTVSTEKTGGGQGQAGPVGTGESGTGGDGNGTEEDPCGKDPMRTGCQKLEAPPEEGALDGSKKGVSDISITPFASAAQCPGNVPLPKGATFKWDPICDFATGIKPILIALAWLSAGFIVMGAFKE